MEKIPPIAIVLMALFSGSAIRAINREGLTILLALKYFITGFAFGAVSSGVVRLIWPFEWATFWPLWFLLAYLGNWIHSIADQIGDRLARNPWKAAKQVLQLVLENLLLKLK